ncbi:MAG: hypothetical protein H6555_10875 [Lewinellaceae bacterium]|nr:hypothetical protein [Lewinellaceae bacterium]
MKISGYSFLVMLSLGLLSSCQHKMMQQPSAPTNPAAPGFNAVASDAKAIDLADQVMEAMGGRTAWDATRFIEWTFFGRRTLLWDKTAGRVRIEIPADSTVFLLNLWDKTGKVLLKGKEQTEPDSLKKYLFTAESIWINDSYWLVMPYKLKDSGVTLRYLNEGATENGKPADVIQLTFEAVGRTPENKYLIYVDKASKLITQWSYFRSAADQKPNFTTSWGNYQRHGKILLSGDRGERQLSNIAVYDQVPDQAFTLFKPWK